jgi:hypothetical protein
MIAPTCSVFELLLVCATLYGAHAATLLFVTATPVQCTRTAVTAYAVFVTTGYVQFNYYYLYTTAMTASRLMLHLPLMLLLQLCCATATAVIHCC